MTKTLQSPFLVGVKHHLRIRAGGEDVPSRFELRPQVEEVVKFPVVHDAAGTILVKNGLLPSGKINNAQAAASQEDTARPP